MGAVIAELSAQLGTTAVLLGDAIPQRNRWRRFREVAQRHAALEVGRFATLVAKVAEDPIQDSNTPGTQRINGKAAAGTQRTCRRAGHQSIDVAVMLRAVSA